MSQQPNPGARVREGREIPLIVSTGVTIFPMPDLRFESLRNASLDLNRLKLAQLDKTTMVANDDVPANHIVSQDPAPLSSVRQGSEVSLTLSKGPPTGVRVPNLSGMQVDDARGAAQRARIHLGQIVWDAVRAGRPAARRVLVRQNPGPGATIDPFQEVSLQVSAGPGEYGYSIRQVHVAATVPARNDTARVRVEVRDDTGTWNVYDGYAQGGQKLDFNVNAVGSAEVDTYVNNELLNQTVVGREPPRTNPTSPPEDKKKK